MAAHTDAADRLLECDHGSALDKWNLQSAVPNQHHFQMKIPFTSLAKFIMALTARQSAGTSLGDVVGQRFGGGGFKKTYARLQDLRTGSLHNWTFEISFCKVNAEGRIVTGSSKPTIKPKRAPSQWMKNLSSE